MFNTSWAKVPRMELTLSRSDVGFLSPSGARKRHDTMQLQQRSDDSAALDESCVLEARERLQLGLRVHHD